MGKKKYLWKVLLCLNMITNDKVNSYPAEVST
jgi:hypothetical protein